MQISRHDHVYSMSVSMVTFVEFYSNAGESQQASLAFRGFEYSRFMNSGPKRPRLISNSGGATVTLRTKF